MTTFEKIDERARRIVRGTQEPLSGWYNSPADLESEIRLALQWAYWMGAAPLLDAIAPFAMRHAEQASGASYRALPDSVWRRALDAYLDAGGEIDSDARRRIERRQAATAEDSAGCACLQTAQRDKL